MLTTLTGEDPLKDKHVSFIGPQVSPHKITLQIHKGIIDIKWLEGIVYVCFSFPPFCVSAKTSLYIRSSNTGI